jgi:hypothetical protein
VIKRVNSLGRKRIPRECVSIEVFDGDPRRFSAQLDFSDQKWDPAASVVMEATCAGSSLVQRFDCGTVRHILQPSQLPLHDLHGQNVFFSLKIIDTSQRIGRLLGIAENIRPITTGMQTVSGRKGILPVEHAMLGHQLWKLEFREHDVFLVVNQEAPGLAERMRSDPVFYSLIYPQIMRQVLAKSIAQGAEPDEDDDRWPTLWLAFGRKLHPDHDEPPSPDDEEAIDEWIDRIVESFCSSHELRKKYVQAAAQYGMGDD